MERLDLVERSGQNHQENGWLEHPYDGINKIKSVLVDMGFEGFDVRLVALYKKRDQGRIPKSPWIPRGRP